MKSTEDRVANFKRLERLAPLGYFAMGIGWIAVRDSDNWLQQRLVIANGSDWTPQPVTLHRSHATQGFEALPCWFSEDYDHHMGLAVGDLTGNGYDDLVVAVFAGKNQELDQGGVKVYLGGPEGLDPSPIWLARGFAATGIALGDLRGTGKLDIVVSCLSERGTIQTPEVDHLDRFTGYARILQNDCSRDGEVRFKECRFEHPAARGAGDVTLADVDGNGDLDLIFAGQRTTVIYGPIDFDSPESWEDCPLWISEEEHPFSFSVVAFQHPNFPGGHLIASSRGLLSATQLKGRTLAEVETGILVHRPEQNRMTGALQKVGGLSEQRPEIPAGLAVTYAEDQTPHLVAGFLDARGRDIRGAALRVFPGTSEDSSLPLASAEGRRLPGGGLMAGRVIARPRTDGPASISEATIEVGPEPQRVISLPCVPLGELLRVDVTNQAGFPIQRNFTRSCNGAALCFSPPLPAHSTVCVAMRSGDEVEIAAASSAAWPPAGASGLWRGRLADNDARTVKDSRPARSVRQAG